MRTSFVTYVLLAALIAPQLTFAADPCVTGGHVACAETHEHGDADDHDAEAVSQAHPKSPDGCEGTSCPCFCHARVLVSETYDSGPRDRVTGAPLERAHHGATADLDRPYRPPRA